MNLQRLRLFVLVVASVVLMSSFTVEGALRIEKAYCGTRGSWIDVTPFLQKELRGDSLSATLSQPFDEIGGDPAPGQPKILLIDYRVDAKEFRLLLEEQYPVAFTITLPSSDAASPGDEQRATELAADAGLAAKPMPPRRVQLDSPSESWERYKVYFPLFASLVAMICSFAAIICAGVALFQVRQVKIGQRTAREAEQVAAPNRGPGLPVGNLGASEEPRSVS